MSIKMKSVKFYNEDHDQLKGGGLLQIFNG